MSQNEKTPSLFGGMHKIDVRSGAVVSLSGGRRERGPGAGAGGGVCAGLGGDPARAGEESGEQKQRAIEVIERHKSILTLTILL